ncbi:hypothetical protein KCP71_15835 [Salmonella enterica subsp. enterica]|nr:hypothetical protein KCP71_15835 [Salmonella enterica subsp. enterica]
MCAWWTAGKSVSSHLPGCITPAARRPARRCAYSPGRQHPQWCCGKRAARATALGSYGVDRTAAVRRAVNGSGGGATLLKDPELIYRARKRCGPRRRICR